MRLPHDRRLICPHLRIRRTAPASRQFIGQPVIATMPTAARRTTALAMVRNASIEPHIIEYPETPPSRTMLKQLISRVGISVRELLCENGTPYAEFGLGDPKLMDEQVLDVMHAHPILSNRPTIVVLNGVPLCRPSEQVRDLLPPQRGEFVKEDGERVMDECGRRVATQHGCWEVDTSKLHECAIT